jgi:hypothetical protein
LNVTAQTRRGLSGQRHNNDMRGPQKRGVSSPPAEHAAASLFVGDDTTVGSETELRAAVVGRREDVALPRTIEQPNYYANVQRRIAAGDTSRRTMSRLQRFLEENVHGIWENSWVRFPLDRLKPLARATLAGDLRAEKRVPWSVAREDLNTFIPRGGRKPHQAA